MLSHPSFSSSTTCLFCDEPPLSYFLTQPPRFRRGAKVLSHFQPAYPPSLSSSYRPLPRSRINESHCNCNQSHQPVFQTQRQEGPSLIAWMPFASSSMKEGEQRIITHPLQQRVYGTTLFPVDSSPAPSPLYPSRMSNCLPSSFATPSQGRGEEKSPDYSSFDSRSPLSSLSPRVSTVCGFERGRRDDSKRKQTRRDTDSSEYILALVTYAH